MTGHLGSCCQIAAWTAVLSKRHQYDCDHMSAAYNPPLEARLSLSETCSVHTSKLKREQIQQRLEALLILESAVLFPTAANTSPTSREEHSRLRFSCAYISFQQWTPPNAAIQYQACRLPDWVSSVEQSTQTDGYAAFNLTKCSM